MSEQYLPLFIVIEIMNWRMGSFDAMALAGRVKQTMPVNWLGAMSNCIMNTFAA